MKGPEISDRERYPELHQAAAAPAEALISLITNLFDDHGIRSPTPQQGANMLWALAHGIGTLALDGQLALGPAPKLAEIGAAAMIDGWRGEAFAAG